MNHLKTKPKYRHVSMPSDLYERILKALDSGLGYRSVAEFVCDAVRRRLEEIAEKEAIKE